MARQYLRITNETTYGTYANPSSPVVNTDFIVPRLDVANAFTMRPAPQLLNIRGFDGFNRRITTFSNKQVLAGNLNIAFYPSQTSFLMNWISTLTGTPDSKSCTIDHAIVGEDGSNTIQYRRYLGVKVGQAHIHADRDTQLFRCELELMAQKPASPNITVTDFPEPAQSLYPQDASPWVFQNMQSPGYLSIATSRAEFASFDLTIKNILDGTFNESTYITRCKWCGRDIDWVDRLVYQTYTDRSDFEAVTAKTCAARIDNGTHHLILTFNANNYFNAVNDDVQLDKVFYQELHFQNDLDQSATTDFSFTYA